jgi:hypothetical protein
VTTNGYGLINVVLGRGMRQTGSQAATFSAIDWSVTPKFIKTEINYGGWKTMGTTRLWAVPYSMVAGDLAGTVDKLDIKGTSTLPEDALFEVKNKDGQTIFGVYNEGVRVYIDDRAKGTKGGFAVGGFDNTKSIEEYLRVTRDSVRITLDSNPLTKGTKGGFAVGGFDMTKGTVQNYMFMNPDNSLIGQNSGTKTSGLYNSFMGFESGFSNTTGAYNALFGYQGGYKNVGGSNNLFLGYQSGFNNTSGSFNSFAGYQAGYSNTGGTGNSFLGSYSGTNNTTGSQNTFIGYESGYLNSIGAYNNFIGYQTGYHNSEGSNNVFLGTTAGYSNTLGKYNIFLGYKSGYNNLAAAGNTFIGYRAGETNTNGGYNVFIGNMAGFANTASNNAFIGNEAGTSNTGGTYNAFLGYQAGKSNTTANNNVFIGNQAGEMNQTTSDNVFIGYLSGQNHTTLGNNVFIGSRAGMNDNSGANNVSIGWRAGEGNQTGQSNVFISVLSGYKNTSGTSNVLIGDQAGINNTSGNLNVIIGREAGLSNSTGSRNIMIGYQAGNAETGSDKLHIGQGSLIYGEMNNKILQFNGLVKVNGNLEFTTGANRHIIFPDALNTLYIGGQPGVTHAPYAISFVTEGPSSIGNTGLIMIGSSQNVGIGRSPAYKLDVSGDRIRLINGTEWIAMRTDGNNGFLDLSYSGGKLVIQGSNADENIILNPSMNKVGIRTWNPVYELDVTGSIRATGSVYYGGAAGIADGSAYSKPDFVFGRDYMIMNAKQVEEFLQKEKHLPWITSADQERKENGNVTDMTRMAFETVETVENLQMQIIDMNKQIQKLSELVSIQQKEIEFLKDR